MPRGADRNHRTPVETIRHCAKTCRCVRRTARARSLGRQRAQAESADHRAAVRRLAARRASPRARRTLRRSISPRTTSTTRRAAIAWFFQTTAEHQRQRHVGLQLTVPISRIPGEREMRAARCTIAMRRATSSSRPNAHRPATRFSYRAIAGGVSDRGAPAAVKSATSALEAVQAGYEVGTRTIVDLLIAQRQLFQAQRDYCRRATTNRQRTAPQAERRRHRSHRRRRSQCALTDERRRCWFPTHAPDADDASASTPRPRHVVDDRPGQTTRDRADSDDEAAPVRDPRE